MASWAHAPGCKNGFQFQAWSKSWQEIRKIHIYLDGQSTSFLDFPPTRFLLGSDLLRSWNQKTPRWSLPIVFFRLSHGFDQNLNSKVRPGTIHYLHNNWWCNWWWFFNLSILCVEIGLSENLSTPQLWWIRTSCFPMCFWPSCGPHPIIYPATPNLWNPTLVDIWYWFINPYPFYIYRNL